jgi:hypothetical protein
MKTLLKIFFILTLCISGCSQKPKKVKIHEVTLYELPEDRLLISFWKEFSAKFNSLDTAAVRKVSLDSIWLWGDHIASDEFINRYYSGYSSSDFLGILDTNKIIYSSIGCHPSPIVKEAVKQQNSDAFKCRKIAIITDTVGSIGKGIEFSFLETTNGYRLFGISYTSYFWRMYGMVDTTTTNE